MKSTFFVFLLGAAIAHGGELEDQFPKHPKVHIVRDTRASTNYGIKQVGIEHTGCFGECPEFTFIVNRDATFRYNGRDFTKRRGKWHGTVNAGQLDSLLRYFSEMGFFDLYDEYTASDDSGDLPGNYLMVVTGTRKKIVYDTGWFAPAKLDPFEVMMFGLMDGAKWKRD